MFTVGVSICINHQQRPVPWCLRDSSVAPGPCGGAESGAALPLFQFVLLWKHHFSRDWPTLDVTGS